ncbi:MAG: hypothetical protein M4579_005296 [Chaenotheca gracillima]|nr:MAG: hypothetical protein M4579_005296 [Chaenotheca gracillima]
MVTTDSSTSRGVTASSDDSWGLIFSPSTTSTSTAKIPKGTATTIPTTLVIATGPPPSATPPTIVPPIAPAPSSTAHPTSHPSADGDHISRPLESFLIAAGAIGAFTLLLLCILLIYRLTTGRWCGFIRRKDPRRDDSDSQRCETPFIEPPPKDWDYLQTFAGRSDFSSSVAPSNVKPSRASSNTALTAHPVTLPRPLILADTTHAIRERNNLLHHNFSRQPLSTLDEQSLHQSESVQLETALPVFLNRSTQKASSFNQGENQNESPLQDSDNTAVSPVSPMSSGGSMTEREAAALRRFPSQPNRNPTQLISRFSFQLPSAPPTPRLSPYGAHERHSIATSVESVPRFRTVSTWVEHQNQRTQQKLGESDTTPSAGSEESNRSSPQRDQSEVPKVPDLPPEVIRQYEKETEEAANRRGQERTARRESLRLAHLRQEERAEAERRRQQQAEAGQVDMEETAEDQNGQGGSRDREERRRKVDSTSTATVFKYHPGEEVRIPGGSFAASEDLDRDLRIRFGSR